MVSTCSATVLPGMTDAKGALVLAALCGRCKRGLRSTGLSLCLRPDYKGSFGGGPERTLPCSNGMWGGRAAQLDSGARALFNLCTSSYWECTCCLVGRYRVTCLHTLDCAGRFHSKTAATRSQPVQASARCRHGCPR